MGMNDTLETISDQLSSTNYLLKAVTERLDTMCRLIATVDGTHSRLNPFDIYGTHQEPGVKNFKIKSGGSTK